MPYPYPGYCGTGRTELTEVPGAGMKVLHNFHRFRVLWCTGVKNFQKFRAGTKNAVPVPRVLWHRRQELPEVPGTGISVLQRLQKFFVGNYPR